jgi:NADH-quinone oxidoreductase subunit M
MPLLSLLIWLPVLGAIIVLLTGSDKNANTARWIALATSIITLYSAYRYIWDLMARVI